MTGETDRLDLIKKALVEVGERVGPDSSLRWLVKEVDRLRAQQEVKAEELRVLYTLLERMVSRLGEAFVINPVITDPDQLVKMVINRYHAAVDDNKNVFSELAQNVIRTNTEPIDTLGMAMLVSREVEEWREAAAGFVNDKIKLHKELVTAIGYNPCPGTDDDRVEELVDHVIYQRRGALTELNEIHDLAAEALGYERAPSLEEDPNCPCPNSFITGDHTAQTLVMELVKRYKGDK
jgi:hypothetical protein